MKKFIGCIAALALCVPLLAQEVSPTQPAPAAPQEKQKKENVPIDKYRRSSLYSVLVKHSAFKFGNTIDSTFMSMPTPDKFNNHDLAIKSFESTAVKQKKKGKEKTDINMKDIQTFLTENDIAKKMVEKWFDRNPQTGAFDMELIKERGQYDASQADIDIADQSALGRGILEDAGEDLINKTFLLINDITFVDKGEKSAKVGGFFRMLGAVASSVTGTDVSSMTDLAADLVNEIDGFSVNITSYLYQLDWTNDVAGTFYTSYWVNQNQPDPARCNGFDTCTLFKLNYVGTTATSAANLSSKSFSNKTKEEQMLKVCTRAIDKSIVQLQREYDEFKVNVPLYSINEDGTVDVQIGLKEGINEKSQFDVLMPTEDEMGKMTYVKVGKIEPVENRIWDNRYGALEDAEALATDPDAAKKANKAKDKAKDDDGHGDVTLTATTFRVLSGANKIVPGCLVREVTIKRDK
ncbi:MAG: hypothetical protein RR279_05030 [Alistipes sp.]